MTDYKKIDKNLQSTNDTSLCPNCNHTMNIIVYCYYCKNNVNPQDALIDDGKSSSADPTINTKYQIGGGVNPAPVTSSNGQIPKPPQFANQNATVNSNATVTPLDTSNSSYGVKEFLDDSHDNINTNHEARKRLSVHNNRDYGEQAYLDKSEVNFYTKNSVHISGDFPTQKTINEVRRSTINIHPELMKANIEMKEVNNNK